jgi:hypothetical protein
MCLNLFNDLFHNARFENFLILIEHVIVFVVFFNIFFLLIAIVVSKYLELIRLLNKMNYCLELCLHKGNLELIDIHVHLVKRLMKQGTTTVLFELGSD